MDTQAQEVINWAIEKLNSYDSEKKLYNISAVILSVLDVICGIIAIFYTSMIVTSVVAYGINSLWDKFIYAPKVEKFDFEAPLTRLVWITSVLSIAMTYGVSYWLLAPMGGKLWLILSTNFLTSLARASVVTTDPFKITSLVKPAKILLRILFSLFSFLYFAISIYLLIY